MVNPIVVACNLKLALVCIAIICVQRPLEAQGQKADTKPIRASIFTAKGGAPTADFDLGQLPSGKEIDAILVVENGSTIPLFFQSLSVGCSCLKATPSGNEIPPDGEMSIAIKLQTPKTAKTASQRTSLLLETTPGAGVNLRISYELTGLLSFIDHSVVVQAEEDVPYIKFQIPVLITDPVSLTDVLVHCSEGLKSMKTELVSDKTGSFVSCSLASDSQTAQGVSGTISLTDTKSGRKTLISCVVDKEASFSVVPSTMYLIRSKDKKGSFIGTAIVKVNRSFLKFPDSKENVFEQPVEIACRADSIEVKLTAVRISTGVYRVNATVTPENDSEGRTIVPGKLFWEADTGTHNLKSESSISWP